MSAMGATGQHPVPQTSPAKKPLSTSKQILLVTVPAVVTLVVGVWLGVVFGPSGSGEATAERPTPPPTTQTTTPPPEPSPSASDEPVVPRGLGEPVTSTSGCAKGSYVWSPATVARTGYDSALVCSFVSDRPSADYLVPAGATTFTATVGLDDGSAEPKSSFLFHVVDAATGRLLWYKNVAYGESAQVEANLDGVLRVRLEIVRTRGVGTDEAVAVWANPKMF